MRNILSVGILLLCAMPAHAEILTAGVWKNAPPPCECGDTTYSNRSLDGENLNAGYVLAEILGLPTFASLTYLDAPFTVENTGPITEIYRRTGYPSTLELLNTGVLQMKDGRGNTYTSTTDTRFIVWLLPAVLTSTGTSQRAFWCGEDLDFPWLSLERGGPTYSRFGDCNDIMQETTFFTSSYIPPTDTPPQISEPGVLALAGIAALGMARRMVARKVR